MIELTTEELNKTQLLEGTKQFIDILININVESVDVEYGYLSREDHEYSTKRNVDITELLEVINNGISNDIIRLGISDFFIKTPGVEYQICNDSDLHVRSDNENLANQVKARWEECGFKVYVTN